MPWLEATFKRKSVFWLTVPEGEPINGGESLAAGHWSLKLADNIFIHKQETVKKDRKWSKINPQSCPRPLMYFL